MASGNYGAVVNQIRRLFDGGTAAGLSEWELLERFAARRDEAAFEAIVARFGPMILGVCRRMLPEESDVEDAFQATFLVLVRKAGTLGPRDALGHWLHGVAYRVALRARSLALRRRARELPGTGAEAVAPSPCDDLERSELAATIDSELARLPSKYRAPIVLCYFEGLSHEEAALRLGWPVGTVKGRLSRARDLLRDRLTRRGLTLPPAALAAFFSREATASAVRAIPAYLSLSTARAAVQVAGGRAAAGVVSATAATLSRGVLTSMTLNSLKIAGATVIVLGIGAGVLAYQAKPTRKQRRAQESLPPATKPAQAGPVRPATIPAQAGPGDRLIQEKLDEKVSMSFPNETPLQDVLKYIKAASQGPNDNGIPIYVDPAGLEETGKTITSTVSLDVEGVPLKVTLRTMLRQLGLDYRVKDGLLTVSSRNSILQKENDELRQELEALKGRLRDGLKQDVEALEARLRVVELKISGSPSPAPPPSKPQGGQGRKADDERTQVILKKLEEPVTMSFPQETPLEDVLKYIKSATAGPNDEVIPIYVDPNDLKNHQISLNSPVTIDLKGIPLKTTLRLLLKQLGLAYKIEDGLMIIGVPGMMGAL